MSALEGDDAGAVATPEQYHAARRFLLAEAEAIDNKEYEDWLAMMTEDIEYRVPARRTKAEGGMAEFDDGAYHVNDNRFMLETRVERLDTEHAWAEQPQTRTRHFVTNIRVTDPGEEEMAVKSNLLLHLNRGSSPESHTIAGERHDVLRKVEGAWKLADRTIYLDHTTLPLGKISVFI